MATVSFDRVDKNFGEGTCAVDDLTLEIDDGEFMIVVGPSGRPRSGSTTATNRSSAAHASSGNHTPSRISSRPESSFASRHARICVGVTRRYT